jgi:hypothetical protein
VVVALLLGAGLAGAPAAAGGAATAAPAWSIQPTQVPMLPTGVLRGISCPTTSWCAAAGYYSDGHLFEQPMVEVWNGTAWAVQPFAPPAGITSGILNGVSCSSPGMCMAVGTYDVQSGAALPLTLRWNGSKWSTVAAPALESSEEVLQGVSCPSPSACEAVGWYTGAGYATAAVGETWNGSTWSLDSLHQPAGTSSELDGVSCTAEAACAAVGGFISTAGVPGTLAEMWNGKTWSAVATPDGSGASSASLAGVSCAPGAAVRCEAVGDGAIAAAWNGRAWSTQRAVGGLSDPLLFGVSCAAASGCMSSGSYYYALGGLITLAERWNGTTWSFQDAKNQWQAGLLSSSSVSCASASVCVAGARYDDSVPTYTSEILSGGRWKLVRPPGPAGSSSSYLESLACPAPTSCTGVGVDYPTGVSNENKSLVDTWNGTGWALAPSTALAGELTGVSCPSTTFCMAVGRGNYVGSDQLAIAGSWNGKTWSADALPQPAGAMQAALLAVSCTTATACLAVGSADSGPYAERWNGSRWSMAPAPVDSTYGNTLDSLSCTASDACTGAGLETTVDGPAILVETWNGKAWAVAHQPALPSGPSTLTGVSCTGAATCAAVGWYDASGGNSVPFAESWNETSWSLDTLALPAGDVQATLDGVSCVAGGCTAFGTYQTAATYGLPLAETTSIAG